MGAVREPNISAARRPRGTNLPEMVRAVRAAASPPAKTSGSNDGVDAHRAIPQLTRIVEFCAEKQLLFSARVSLDGIGDIHNQVRHVERGFDKACQTIEAMQALSARHSSFQFGIAATIFATNLEDSQNILAWARTKNLDIVFNMLRFTDAMLHNKELEEKTVQTREKDSCSNAFHAVCRRVGVERQSFRYANTPEHSANGYIARCRVRSSRGGTAAQPDGSFHREIPRSSATCSRRRRGDYFKPPTRTTRGDQKRRRTTC